MDERDEKRELVEDLAVPEGEHEEVKGGAGGGAWYLKNTNSPGVVSEGAEPHLHPGGANADFRGGV